MAEREHFEIDIVVAASDLERRRACALALAWVFGAATARDAEPAVIAALGDVFEETGCTFEPAIPRGAVALSNEVFVRDPNGRTCSVDGMAERAMPREGLLTKLARTRPVADPPERLAQTIHRFGRLGVGVEHARECGACGFPIRCVERALTLLDFLHRRLQAYGNVEGQGIVMRALALFTACLLGCSSPPDVTNDGGDDATVVDASITESSTPDAGDAATEAAPLPGFYGVPWNADALSNDQIGYQPKRQADIRFRSQGGTFVAAKIFFIVATYVQRSYCNQPPFTSSNPNNCYAAGTGGTIRVDLVDDDGTSVHAPTTNVLSTITITDPMNITAGPPIYGVTDANFRLLTNFSAKPALVAGQLYHLLFTNLDADPTQNYISIDCLYHSLSNVNREPGVSDTDLATLLSDDGKTWIIRKETPIFQVQYQDGHNEGQGYMGTRVTVPAPIVGAARARETFTPVVTHTVNAVSVRLQASGTPQPLVLRLEQGDGTLVEQGMLDASTFSKAIAQWSTFKFASPHVLTAGQPYNLVLTAPAGASSYLIYPLEKGTNYGFDPKLVFPDGHADYDLGDGGFPTVYGPWGGMSKMDYQLYFTTQ